MRSVALVLRRTEIRAIPLPARAELSKTIEALLGDPERHIDASRVSAAQAAWIEPLGLKADVRRVLVSPTGRLGYVPFSLLLPDREIVYVPSGSTYALLRAEVGGPGKGVLAVGDAEYQGVVGAPEGTRRPGPKLTQLPATRQEVESVGTQRLLGADATESKVRAALGRPARWRAVHFACHGLIDPDRPRFSSLALTADAQDDGSWTALEIFRERVDAELVVLSACETGRGRIYRAEGIVGLTRAFMYAGAPRVICSLWKVDDVATRTLMVEFYRRWSEGRSAAAALRDAQRHVRSLEKWKHPYYWAAFVLWGLP